MPDLTALLREVWRRDRVLTAVGLFHLGLLAVFAMAAPFDERQILGINPWIKPMKFCISIAIYLLTLAWFIDYLAGPRWALRIVRWGASVSMIVEIVCIAGQSLRGRASHFNTATGLDGAIFGVMGLMILVNTLVLLLLLLLFILGRTNLTAPYLLAIRLGLVVVLLGSGVGQRMIAGNAHSVGGADGGPGVPILNWSSEHGDLRAAHAMGLHGLQLVPLFGFLVSRRKQWSGGLRLAAVAGFAALYVAAGAYLYMRALAGTPLLPI